MKEQQTLLVRNEIILRRTYIGALLPAILSILSGCINIIVDGILVGQRAGVGGLAAINLSLPIYLVLCVMGSFFVAGTAIPAAGEMGKGNVKAAQAYYELGVGYCLLCSLLSPALGLPLMPFLSRAFSGEVGVQAMILTYGRITLLGAGAKILLYIPFWFLRLEGKNRQVAVMMLIMGGGNILLDVLFLYGLSMGVGGAALASVISSALAVVYGFYSFHRPGSNFSLRARLRMNASTFRIVASHGSPSALNNVLPCFRILTVNACLTALGGSILVAVFAAVNGISAFAEAVTVGAPQAGNAMMGVFHGERDNESAGLLLRLEWRFGLVLSLLFAAGIYAGADLIGRAYALSGVSMGLPMLCLGISLIPGLFNSMIMNFYHVTGRPFLANLLVICRVYVTAALTLLLCTTLGISPWLFLPLSEVETVLLWLLLSRREHRRYPETTRFLLLDTNLDRIGRVLAFSLPGNVEEICSACERIFDFCLESDLPRSVYMKLSLSIEELLIYIVKENTSRGISFDLRIFSLPGETGIRIRYGGKRFDPGSDGNRDEDAILGYRLIQKLAKHVIYRQIFGVNTLLILV